MLCINWLLKVLYSRLNYIADLAAIVFLGLGEYTLLCSVTG